MKKKSAASDALMNQLSKTLKPGEQSKITVKDSLKPSESRKTSATPTKKAVSPNAAKKPTKVGKVSNQNFSLYPESQDQIFEIISLIRKETGSKCSDSRAVQVALKICPLKDKSKILKAFAELQAYDGRTSRHNK